MLFPGPQSPARYKKKKKKKEKRKKKSLCGVGGHGREVVVYWSLATLEMKAPVEGAETVSGGSVSSPSPSLERRTEAVVSMTVYPLKS